MRNFLWLNLKKYWKFQNEAAKLKRFIRHKRILTATMCLKKTSPVCAWHFHLVRGPGTPYHWGITTVFFINGDILCVAPYLIHEKSKILYNTFVMSNFNYCPLIWMYHGKTSNNQVDRVRKRALRILHNHFNAQFEVLLEVTDEQKVHTKNLQTFMLQNL